MEKEFDKDNKKICFICDQPSKIGFNYKRKKFPSDAYEFNAYLNKHILKRCFDNRQNVFICFNCYMGMNPKPEFKGYLERIENGT